MVTSSIHFSTIATPVNTDIFTLVNNFILSFANTYIFTPVNNFILSFANIFVIFVCMKTRTMSRQEKELQEIKEFLASIREDKEKSLALLVDAGILTKSGKFTKPYKNLCIPVVAG